MEQATAASETIASSMKGTVEAAPTHPATEESKQKSQPRQQAEPSPRADFKETASETNVEDSKENKNPDIEHEEAKEVDVVDTMPAPLEDVKPKTDDTISGVSNEEIRQAEQSLIASAPAPPAPPAPLPSPQRQQQQQLPPTAKPSQASTEIVQSLFGLSVGVCWGDFSCQYNHVRGRLYASTEAVLFYSNLFGFEKKINLSYDRIIQISLFRQTSIQVIFQDEEDAPYIFKGFSDRSPTLKLLIELWRQCQGIEDGHPTVETPNNMNNNTEKSLSPTTLPDTPTQSISTPPPPRSQTKQTTPSSTPNQTLLPDLPSHRKRSKSVPNLNRRRSLRRDPPQSPKNDPQVNADDDFDWNQNPTETDRSNWEAAKKSAGPWVKEMGVEPIHLKCSLQNFYHLFLANEAPHSLEKFQTSDAVKDRNVRVTPWVRDDDDNTLTRRIEFEHPVSASFGVGPSHAPTKRQQTLQRYPGLGITIQSKSTVEGLPGSDCFVVEDMWIVEQRKNDDCSVQFSSQFGANFFKRTFLKSIIAKNIKAGTKEWYEGYQKMVKTALKESAKDLSPTAAREENTAVMLPESNTSKKSGLDTLDGKMVFVGLMACQFFILLVLLFVVTELRISHRTTEVLIEEMKLLRLEHGNTLTILLEGRNQ